MQDITFTDTFTVCDGIALDFLVGLRFQRANKAIIDTDACTLTLSDGTLDSKQISNTQHVTAHVFERYIIPAHSQSFISCRLDNEQSNPDEDWWGYSPCSFIPFSLNIKYVIVIIC